MTNSPTPQGVQEATDGYESAPEAESEDRDVQPATDAAEGRTEDSDLRARLDAVLAVRDAELQQLREQVALVAGYADVWSVAIIFWRDAVVSMLRVVSAGQSVVLAARTAGKAKAVVQAVGILAILVFGVVPVFPPGGVGGVTIGVNLPSTPVRSKAPSGWWMNTPHPAVPISHWIGTRPPCVRS